MRALQAMVWMCAALAAGVQAQAPAAPAAEALSATPEPEAASATPDTVAARDSAGLRAYVAGVVEGLLLRNEVAGMVVAVVRDGETLLTSGYGMASLEPARAANGERSMFRIGSTSKTFTYTAAMQLIEQGRLALDDPINERLPEALRVPDDGYAEPIRVRHLFTHSAGYEDTALGHLFAKDPARVKTLEQYLVEHRPRRVRPPGALAVYSNYSLGLLGAIVAHVSAERFEDYVEAHLTGPLGMSHATFREPALPAADPRRLDAALAGDIAAGYARRNGAFEPQAFEHIAQIAPAGGMSASAADMARWMRMHLGEGELDGVRVLSAASAARMREVLLRNAPEAAGIAHGFLTERYGAYEAYGHGGATLQFHTAMVLLPAQELGVFVSANTDNARGVVRDVARLIVERLVMDARPAPKAAPLDAAALARFAGTYRSNRRPYATVEKLLLGLGGDATVVPAEDGSLRVSVGGETTRLVPLAPLVFQAAEGNARVQFIADAAGAITGYVPGVGAALSERVRLLERADVLFALVGLAFVIALVRIWRAPRRRRQNPEPRPGLVAVKVLSVLGAIAWIGFGVGLVAAAIAMGAEGNDVLYTYPSRGLIVALWLALAAAALTALEVLALVPVWGGDWRAWPKLRYTLAVAILALTVWAMWTWNLIGLKV